MGVEGGGGSRAVENLFPWEISGHFSKCSCSSPATPAFGSPLHWLNLSAPVF